MKMMSTYKLSEESLYNEIVAISRKYNVKKVVLFGSRARKTNDDKSDIDLAIYGCKNFRELYFDLNENVPTLLSFDIIDMDSKSIDENLIKEIKRDGVILYEKI